MENLEENTNGKSPANLLVPCGIEKCQVIRLCVCKLSQRHNQELNKHISVSTRVETESVHFVTEGKKSPVKCGICDAKFMSKNSLNYHVASTHEGKKPFKCNICNAVFTSKQGKFGHIAAIHEMRIIFA